tara:strand:+ start:582 stop:944 length:363 start_codon:yes stop_codon:yes gene_type:complete
MRHEAIYSLYPNVVKIGDIAGAFDANGNKVEVDESLVQEKVEEFLATQPLKELREERNQKLQETDWTQYRDVSLSNDSGWQTYRQSLRDLPQNFSPIIDIITEDGYPIVKEQTDWPTKPE